MRFHKPEILLRLALLMQGSAEGVSLADIQRDVGVSRRTAERMRDAVLRVYPQAEDVPGAGRQKRWRIPSRTLNDSVSFSADELGHVSTAAALLRHENLPVQAAALDYLVIKLKALMSASTIRRAESDLEVLLEAEGLAWRPGPRPTINPETLEALRQATKRCATIRIAYDARISGRRAVHTVQPYGFLYGNKHYLVAYNPKRSVRDFALFSIAHIKKVTTLAQPFARDPKFSLKDYVSQSFGIWRGKPFETIWQFSAQAAANAREYVFHPSQVLEPQPDGSLIVRLKAASDREMAYHLMTWGTDVEVLKPIGLRRMLARMTGRTP